MLSAKMMMSIVLTQTSFLLLLWTYATHALHAAAPFTPPWFANELTMISTGGNPLCVQATVGKNISQEQTTGVVNYAVDGILPTFGNFSAGGGFQWDWRQSVLGGGFRTGQIALDNSTRNFINGGFALNSTETTFGASIYAAAANDDRVNVSATAASANVVVDQTTGQSVFLLTSSRTIICQNSTLSTNNSTEKAVICTAM